MLNKCQYFQKLGLSFLSCSFLFASSIYAQGTGADSVKVDDSNYAQENAADSIKIDDSNGQIKITTNNMTQLKESLVEKLSKDPKSPFYQIPLNLDQQTGVALESIATIDKPEGFLFFGKKYTQVVMKRFDNLSSNKEIGLMNCVFSKTGLEYGILFEFDNIGYVKDDEKSSINEDELLTALKNNVSENEARAKEGLSPINIIGWAIPPKYNEQFKCLEWAILFEVGGRQHVNFKTKVLGRKGVVDVNLMCNPQNLLNILPEFRNILTSFKFNDGERYDQYQQGDKIAEYGLTGLILGGAVATAWYLGLLKPILKYGWIVLIAIGAVIKKGWRFIFRKKDDEYKSL